MDFVFTNDHQDFLVNKLTTVEKLGHAFHMHAVWAKTQKRYLELKKNLPANMNQVSKDQIVKQKMIVTIRYKS
jgi:hypothetical protein